MWPDQTWTGRTSSGTKSPRLAPGRDRRDGPGAHDTHRPPEEDGGADEHPQPVELLVAALIGCEQATAAFVARHMTPRLALAGLTFEYVARRDERGATSLPLHAPLPVPARLTGVTGVATVHLVRGAGPETAERVDELRRLTEESVRWPRRCERGMRAGRPVAPGRGVTLGLVVI